MSHLPKARRWAPRAAALYGVLVGGLLGVGCGASAATQASAQAPASSASAPPNPAAAATPAASAASSTAAASSAPTSVAPSLPRASVDAVLRQGPAWLLRRVRTEEVLKETAFVGWRLLELPRDWAGLDLRPGDVVTRVNGKTLERPDDLFSAWSALTTAKELRISYQRGATKRELAWVLEGPLSEPPAALQEDATPPSKPAPQAPPKKTVIIVGEEPEDGED